MNYLPNIYLQQEERIRKNSLQHSLYIQVMKENCRVMIIDQDKDILLLEEHSLASFLAKEWPFVNLRFAETKVLTLAESFIFIPKEFENQDADELLSPFLSRSSTVLSSPIQGLSQTNITTYFTVQDQVAAIQALLSESTIVPSANTLIRDTLSIAGPAAEHIGINCYSDTFELAYIKDQEFLFYNRFAKDHLDDFNFYLLSVMDLFGIQAASAHFHLSGDVKTEDMHFQCLSKYSTNVLFSSAKQEIGASLSKNEMAQHSFFLLSELSKCAS